MESILPDQPESKRALLKRSFRLYRLSLKESFLYALLLSIVIFLPRIILFTLGNDVLLNLPPYSPHRLWFILTNILGLLFFIALLWRIHCVSIGLHEPFKEDLTIGIKKVITAFIAVILQTLIVFAVSGILLGFQVLLAQKGFMHMGDAVNVVLITLLFVAQLFIILYVMTLFIFLLPLIAVENYHIFAAIERSISLSWNHWWHIFSLQIIPWVTYLILLMVFKFALDLNINIYFLVHAESTIWSIMLQLLVFTFFIPWVASVLLVQLRDLELRKKAQKKI